MFCREDFIKMIQLDIFISYFHITSAIEAWRRPEVKL